MRLYSKLYLSGLTLWELAVLLLVAAVIVVILFPRGLPQKPAKQTICADNQRQIAAAIQMYAQDHLETTPSIATIWSEINVDAGVLICPKLGKKYPNGYGYNTAMASMSYKRLADPMKCLLTADIRPATVNNLITIPADIDPRHNGKGIASYADGHIETIDVKPGLLAVKLTPPPMPKAKGSAVKKRRGGRK